MIDNAAKPRRVLAMSSLGRNGRFGNQIFQYAFMRIYAQRHELEIRVPHWPGQDLFGFRDQPLGDLRLPMFHDQVGEGTVLDKLDRAVVNVDLCGYFQYHTRWYAPSRDLFRRLFQPIDSVRAPLDRAVAQLREGGRTVVGIHLRRGDFGRGIHYVAPSCWYIDWLNENWGRWKDPVLFIASDDMGRVCTEFSRFTPFTSASLGVHLEQASYYPDHYLLSQCDVMATSNSSFSFSAAMLNERAVGFWRPSRRKDGLISFDPWNSDPCLRECNSDEEAIYYDRIYGEIERAVKALRSGQPGAEGMVRKCRRELADLWLGMNEDTLRIIYSMSLGAGQRLLSSPECRLACLRPEECSYAEKLLEALFRTGIHGVWSIQYLLAAMLYWPVEKLPIEHDLAAIPVWLEQDYLAYLRGQGDRAASAARS